MKNILTQKMDVVDNCSADVVFDCLICNQEYDKKEILIRHMFSAHTRPRVLNRDKMVMSSNKFNRLLLTCNRDREEPTSPSNTSDILDEVSSNAGTGTSFSYESAPESTSETASASSANDAVEMVREPDSAIGEELTSVQLCQDEQNLAMSLDMHNESDCESDNICFYDICDVGCNEIIIDHAESTSQNGAQSGAKVQKKKLSSGNDERKFPCAECGARLKTHHGLTKHYKNVHLGYRKYKCECGLLFKHLKLLNNHRKATGHTNYQDVDEYESDVMRNWETAWRKWVGFMDPRKNSETREKLDVNPTEAVKKRSTDILGIYDCKCGHKYTTKISLRRHIEAVHLNIKNYRCQCGNEFYYKTELDVHRKFEGHESHSVEKLTHGRPEEALSLLLTGGSSSKRKTEDTGISDVMCHQCGEVLPSLKHLTRHEQLHKNRAYICSFCQLEFKTPIQLKRHLKTHVDCETLNCTLCDSFFVNLEDLRQHYKSSHSDYGKPEFTCDICCRPFMRKTTMKMHRIRHSDIKNYVCDVCQKTFHLKGQLKQHYSDVHLKAKQFLCFICKHRYSSKTELEKHMATHKSERPFLCTICQSTYKTKNSLEVHMQNAHGLYRRGTTRVRVGSIVSSASHPPGEHLRTEKIDVGL